MSDNYSSEMQLDKPDTGGNGQLPTSDATKSENIDLSGGDITKNIDSMDDSDFDQMNSVDTPATPTMDKTTPVMVILFGIIGVHF